MYCGRCTGQTPTYGGQVETKQNGQRTKKGLCAYCGARKSKKVSKKVPKKVGKKVSKKVRKP